VLAAGVPAGKRVGEVLAALETLWLERNFTLGRAELTARLEQMVKDTG
jgi:poly(A) polymerase